MGYRPRRGNSGGDGIGRLALLAIVLAPLALLYLLNGPSGPLPPLLRPDEWVWWWTNENPPELNALGPAGAVRGETSVQIGVRPPERASLVAAQIDGQPLSPATLLTLDTQSLADGTHHLQIVAEDRSRRRNQSSVTLTIVSDNTPPTLDWEITPVHVSQGNAALITARANEPAALEALVTNRPLKIEQRERNWWGLLAFGPEADIGPQPLALSARDLAGNETRVDVPFSVAPASFVAENVEVPSRMAAMLGPEIRKAEDDRLAPVYRADNGPARWSGSFLQPVQGPVVTEFGVQRAYNGGPLVGHHAGVDLAAAGGSPVLAAQAARVALIDEFVLRGTTLVLDHGLGVYTTYAHLQEVLVQPGQIVSPGQPVARVGSTGLSTGPHLHWEVWVGGANVDPVEWLQIRFP